MFTPNAFRTFEAYEVIPGRYKRAWFRANATLRAGVWHVDAVGDFMPTMSQVLTPDQDPIMVMMAAHQDWLTYLMRETQAASQN